MGSFSIYSCYIPSSNSINHSKILHPSKPLILPRSSSLWNPNQCLKHNLGAQFVCLSAKDASNSVPSGDNISSNFCIIEGPETVQDFVQMQSKEIQDNIRSRRNKIFLLMEEVRRLRVQQRLKSLKVNGENSEEDSEMPEIPSSIPFLPHVTPKTLKQLYLTSFKFISGIIIFGGLIAPTMWFLIIRWAKAPRNSELIHAVSSVEYFESGAEIRFRWHLLRRFYTQYAFTYAIEVDPIVASFSGGAVGVISALMLLEANNVEQQEKKRCKYCHGTGYLACARCSSSGVCLNTEPISVSSASESPLRAPTTRRCLNCSGVGKVMCPTCLCTGMLMASEHDHRIDPFD